MVTTDYVAMIVIAAILTAALALDAWIRNRE
jgi:hypothetical protein